MTQPPADAFADGLGFHRLVFARRRPGWWTPLVVGLVGLAFYVVLTLLGVVALLVWSLVDPTIMQRLLAIGEGVAFDLADPLIMAVVLGSIALMLPAYVLASLLINGRRVGLVSSAFGRLRWRWMLLCAAAGVVVAGVVTGLSFLLPAEETGGEVLQPGDNPQLWATLIVLLLVVPFQAASEEYVFRGYLMQAIGRWLRHPAFAILLPVPLFVLGHLYDPLGQVSVGVFAVAAGWLTWRTGGLEAAISIHVVNNLLAFLLALAGLSDVNATSPGILSFIVSTVMVGAYVALVEVMFRRSGMPRTLRLTAPVAVPVPPVEPQAAMPSASRIV
ncbi:CPBP family intramembrane metalloprotease [Microbacterium aoyamense]|uniref:CPBP family intramembrane metalloprotease n=1 Tax=Microbacterium aoyamense TaxID=344166 RepID=A0ABN2PZM6_9MICO|nr:type II CAAX endopeptidase family protein [Microbacterium aoyamense]